MSEHDPVPDLVTTARALSALVESEDRFTAIFEAFRASDGAVVRGILDDLKLGDELEPLCEWLCSKDCVLRCWELSGPPIIDKLPDLQAFGEVLVRLTSDEELVERLAEPVLEPDPEAWRGLFEELDLTAYMHLVCQWVCSIHCRLLCDRLDEPGTVTRRHLVEALVEAGDVVRTLIADKQLLGETSRSWWGGDCENARAIVDKLGLVGRCHWVCSFLCSWGCTRVCIDLCSRFEITDLDTSVHEAYGFAQAIARLSETPEVFGELAAAVADGDGDRFEKVVREYRLVPYCFQLCHWICGWRCRLVCRCVCTPVLQPWFTHIGHFDIYSDIASGTGLTNKALAYSGLYYGGGPNFGFTGVLELRGYCPAASPIDGTAMKYRFLVNGTAVTGSRVSPVDVGTRIVSWPSNSGGTATGTFVSTFQSVQVAGAPTTEQAPPAPGDPWRGPDVHTIVPDPAGWILVDSAAIAGGFTTLVGYASWVDVPGGDADSAATNTAGAPAAPAQNGSDIGIVFEATRTSTLAMSPPDSTNAVNRVKVSNWSAEDLLDLVQFGTGGCTPISSQLDVLYTADHELMAAWSVAISSASGSAPGTVASGVGPRGGDGTVSLNTSAWLPCSYTVSLSTRPALTTGLIDDTGRTDSLTFCKGTKPVRPIG